MNILITHLAITCFHREHDFVLVIIPFPVLEIYIESKGLASSHNKLIGIEKLCVMVSAVLKAV